MAGTPDPVLGSEVLTWALGVVAAAVVVAVPLVRDRSPNRFRFAALGGFVYALVGVALWFGVRIAVGRFPPSLWPSTVAFLWVLLIGTVALGAQAALAWYLHRRWSLYAPLAPLAAGTALATVMFLSVGGESDALFIYSFVMAPLVLAAEALLALAEEGSRRLYEAVTKPA